MPASAKSDPGLSLPFNRAFVGVIQRYGVFQANPVVGIRVGQLSADRAFQLLPLAAAGFQAGGVGVQEPAVPVSEQNKEWTRGQSGIQPPNGECRSRCLLYWNCSTATNAAYCIFDFFEKQ